MPFKLIEENEADERVQAAYEQVKARYGGFLPDIYKAFANDPAYLESINEHMRASGISLKPYASKSATTSLITRRSAGSLSATMGLMPPMRTTL